MSLHNIYIVSLYEARLLRRSWLFRIFAALALLVISSLHFSTQSNLDGFQWNMVAMSSSIPFVNIYIFNIAQSIIAIFLAGDFMKRDKKLDTAEVIYVRPISNADYIAGKTAGIVAVFVSLNMLALLIAAFINIFASESPFNPFAYLFYLLTLSVPSLIFVLGTSFIVMNLVKNQAITLILLMGYIGVSLIYLGNTAHGAFDFFAMTLPNIFSDITGHPNLSLYLMQRAAFLLLGIGLLTFTVSLTQRLPQHPRRKILLSGIGIIFFLAGFFCCFSYIDTYRQRDGLRADYLEKYRKYTVPYPAHLIRATLTLQQQASTLSVHSRLVVENKGHQEIKPILLYLNPSLNISRLTASGSDLPYQRDQQIILIDKGLRPYEQLEIQMDYSGGICEDICYLDIPENSFYDTKNGSSVLRYGKRYAYVDDRYTLLTPECLWYPVTVSPVNPENLYNTRKNFTHFTLKVHSVGKRRVLSQGEEQQIGDTILFQNAQPLPSISLAIGEYEKKSVMLDSISLEIYHFKGHDYFSKEFAHLTDTLVPVIRSIRDDYEVRKNRDYPFKKLVLAETPVSFSGYARNWKGASECVQPEILFLPEMGTTLPFGSFKLSKQRALQRERNRTLDETEVEIRVLREFISQVFLSENVTTEEGNLFVNDLFSNGTPRSSQLNKYDISPLYFNYVHFFRSGNFPIMDVLLNTLLKQEEVQRGGWWRRFSGMNDAQRAAEYLKEKSFEQAVMDRELTPEIVYEMLKLKANYLKNYILAQRSSTEFARFMKEFSQKHAFSSVNFTTLNNDFTSAFGINLMDLIPGWYTTNRTPIFIVRDVNAVEVIVDEYTYYMTSFKIHNPTDIEGIASVRVEERGGGRGPRQEPSPKHYIIPPKGLKEIRTLAMERPNSIVVNMNISQNLPNEVSFSLQRPSGSTRDTTTGIFETDVSAFAYNPREITVDNEDPGFKTIDSNQKNTLQTLFNIGGDDRYKNMNFWLPPSRWTATVGSNFHGDYIKSGFYKKSGSGQNLAEWNATISIPGFYEIFIYNPNVERGGRNEEDTYQYYTVIHDDGKDVIEFQTNREHQTWVSIGNFYFSEGGTKIILNDKGASPRQLIFADAVRWVYKNN